jgi:hypothetical protein
VQSYNFNAIKATLLDLSTFSLTRIVDDTAAIAFIKILGTL